MRKLLSRVALSTAAFAISFGVEGQTVGKPPEGSKPLFEGKDLAAWKVSPVQAKHWTIKDGAVLDLNPEGKPREDLTLWSKEEFKDAVISVEWRWSGKPYKIKHPVVLPDGSNKKGPDGKDLSVEIDELGDSGVYLRGSSKAQVNMWCWNTGSGEVYGYRTDAKMSPEVRAGVTPKKNTDKPAGEWNHMIITIKGDRLTVWQNGEEVITSAQLPGIPEKGPIALQDHGNPIQFRNVYIKELK